MIRKIEQSPFLRGTNDRGWRADFDFILSEGNFVNAHYCDKGATNRPCDQDGMLPLLSKEQTTSGSARSTVLDQIQTKLATGTLPLLPLLSGKQVAVTHGNISGVQETLDPTYKFRMWLFSKS